MGIMLFLVLETKIFFLKGRFIMNRDELATFINKHKESDDFTGGIDETQVNIVQSELGLELP